MSMWSGRFKEPMDPDAFEFNASIKIDKRLALQDIRGSKVWAAGLYKADIITLQEFQTLSAGLAKIEDEFIAGIFEFSEGDEDIHSAVERRLSETIGPTAGKLHTGRSRNDQVATDLRLWILDYLPVLEKSIIDFQQILIKKAESDLSIIMPGYSHLQPGQPVMLSHWWMSFFWPLERDRLRLGSLKHRTSVLPLGSGAFAGSPFSIDRFFLTKELGFEVPSQNSIDGVSDRDFVAEFLFACSMIGIHLAKLSEAMVIFTNPTFNFFQLPDSHSTGSSLMPQKKNPDMFELSRGKSGTLIGLLMGWMSTLKALPSSYDKDLQEDKFSVFTTFDTVTKILPVIGKTIEKLKPVQDSLKSAITPDLMATDLADYLVRKGIPFRDSHHIVGQLVQISSEIGRPLKDLTLDEFKKISSIIELDVYTVFDPYISISRKESFGGTSETTVTQQIENAKLLLKNFYT